jgi:hypothetical protein
MKRFAVGLLLVFVCLGAVQAAEPSLLIRVERRAPDDLATLVLAGLPVVMETNPCLFLEGDESHLAWLEEHGYAAAILDRDPGRSDYLMVGLRPDSDVKTVEALGPVLLREENWLLVRIPRWTTLESLYEARVFATRLSHQSVELPRPSSLSTGFGAAGTDAAVPLVQQIVNAVSAAQIDQLWSDVTTNPPTGGRYTTSQGCRDAATYVHDKFAGYGIPASYQNWNAGNAPNSIGTWIGAVSPDVVYIVEGHLDDLPSSGPAPGADDNASGSVTVLEAARVMSCYAFRNTVKFMTVTGEETGLNGSWAYADDAHARNENIQGVLNFDMPGWQGDGIPNPENLDLDYNAASQGLAQRFVQAAADYGTGLAVDAFLCPSLNASDHYPFWANGYAAVCGITDNEGYCGHGGNYPYYHTSNDTIANCGDKTFFRAVVKTTVATLAELAEPFKIALNRASYGCSGTPIEVVVGDRDLNTNPGVQQTVTVQLWSTTEGVAEDLVLTEESTNSMIFRGTITTSTAPPVHGDGFLSIAAGDTITTRYVDALDCNGATNVTYTTTAATDCIAPVISGVGLSGVTDTAATVTWTTDELSDSAVKWGQTTPPGLTTTGNTNTTSHQVQLGGLQQCTVYYYDVRSTDGAGNLTVDNSGGQYYHFETLGNFGSGLQPCHAGKATLDRKTLSCSDSVPARLVDMDLNVSASLVDTALVTVSSSTETRPETVTLVETGINTSTFTGSIPTVHGPAVPGNGVLEVSDGDAITATYHDANDGTGVPAVSYDTGTADCAGPALSGVRVTDLTDDSAIVRWNTSEPTTGRVDWGSTSALGIIVLDPTLATSHAVTLRPLTECGRFFFRVTSTDAYGNFTIVDNQGAPLEFYSYTIPGAVFRDGFETTTGWTLEGEWQIGGPQGRGTSPGDPTAAFEGTKVLGHDLTGLGTNLGDYEPKKTEAATSPVINASALTQGQLKFRRWLNVGGGGISSIDVKRGAGWIAAWTSNSVSGLTESSWSLQTLDISALADGNASLQIRFKQYGGLSTAANRAGWNVDLLIVKSGNLPDFDACGNCGGAPSFAGLTAAADAGPCADTGVTVSWNEASAWGTGRAGSYSVYRDPSPTFTPSAANRVGTGVTGTSWTDAGAPNGVVLYYIVRAENDETCSSGPRNGGVTDANLVRLSARDDVSQPAPGDVGGTLRAAGINAAHVRLTWSAAPNAARYHVYRAQTPQGAFTQIADLVALLYEDRDQMGNSSNWYYRIVAVDACGNEGP